MYKARRRDGIQAMRLGFKSKNASHGSQEQLVCEVLDLGVIAYTSQAPPCGCYLSGLPCIKRRQTHFSPSVPKVSFFPPSSPADFSHIHRSASETSTSTASNHAIQEAALPHYRGCCIGSEPHRAFGITKLIPQRVDWYTSYPSLHVIN